MGSKWHKRPKLPLVNHSYPEKLEPKKVAFSRAHHLTQFSVSQRFKPKMNFVWSDCQATFFERCYFS